MLKGGGTDDQCVKLAWGLRQLGNDACVIGPPDREFSKVAQQLHVPLRATPPEGLMKLRYIVAAARFIRRDQSQIVHGHHGRDIWPTILAARFSGVKPKIVLTRHLAKSPGSWFSKRFMLGQCDAVIAVSEFVANVLKQGASEPDSPEAERRVRPPVMGDHRKIHVIHGGIDTARFFPSESPALRKEWGLDPSHFAFAVAGGYDLPRGKGQREFLMAAARIHQQVPNARFIILGRGSMRDILLSEILRLGLQGKASLAPYCQDMPAAMNAMDCLVHPQIGTESFGLVVCEALACGKPVIASALDGIPEAFATTGYGALVAPEDVPALAVSMQEWANRPRALTNERALMNLRVAEKVSLLIVSKQTEQLYERLLRTPALLP